MPDMTKPLRESIEPWRRNGRRMNIYYARPLRSFAALAKIDLDTPYADLPAKTRTALMGG